jgi:Uma2 family endonuclease
MTLTVGLTYGVIEIPLAVQHDIDTFREWAGDNDLPENSRVCFHRGEVLVEVGKEQIFSHVLVKTAITAVLFALANSRRSGLVLSDGVLLTNTAAGLSCNPDAVFASNEARADGRVTKVPGAGGGVVELVGTPDMVLEVVSDSSEKKDNETLFGAYYEAGIPEYWVVDARGDAIEFQIYKRGAKRYTATRPQPGGWTRSAVFGGSFRLVRSTDPVGDPTFTLEVK